MRSGLIFQWTSIQIVFWSPRPGFEYKDDSALALLVWHMSSGVMWLQLMSFLLKRCTTDPLMKPRASNFSTGSIDGSPSIHPPCTPWRHQCVSASSFSHGTVSSMRSTVLVLQDHNIWSKACCGLDLPGETELPVYINSHFAVLREEHWPWGEILEATFTCSDKVNSGGNGINKHTQRQSAPCIYMSQRKCVMKIMWFFFACKRSCMWTAPDFISSLHILLKCSRVTVWSGSAEQKGDRAAAALNEPTWSFDLPSLMMPIGHVILGPRAPRGFYFQTENTAMMRGQWFVRVVHFCKEAKD